MEPIKKVHEICQYHHDIVWILISNSEFLTHARLWPLFQKEKKKKKIMSLIKGYLLLILYKILTNPTYTVTKFK